QNQSVPRFFVAPSAGRRRYALSLRDALPIWRIVFRAQLQRAQDRLASGDGIHLVVRDLHPCPLLRQAQQEAWMEIPYYKMDSIRSEEHTSELQSRFDVVCRLLLGKKRYRLDS